MTIWDLHLLIAAVCPIDSIDSSGSIYFKPAATEAQKAAAQSIMALNLPKLAL